MVNVFCRSNTLYSAQGSTSTNPIEVVPGLQLSPLDLKRFWWLWMCQVCDPTPGSIQHFVNSFLSLLPYVLYSVERAKAQNKEYKQCRVKPFEWKSMVDWNADCVWVYPRQPEEVAQRRQLNQDDLLSCPLGQLSCTLNQLRPNC